MGRIKKVGGAAGLVGGWFMSSHARLGAFWDHQVFPKLHGPHGISPEKKGLDQAFHQVLGGILFQSREAQQVWTTVLVTGLWHGGIHRSLFLHQDVGTERHPKLDLWWKHGMVMDSLCYVKRLLTVYPDSSWYIIYNYMYIYTSHIYIYHISWYVKTL